MKSKSEPRIATSLLRMWWHEPLHDTFDFARYKPTPKGSAQEGRLKQLSACYGF